MCALVSFGLVKAPTVPTHTTKLNRSVLGCLCHLPHCNSPLPHSIYIGAQLIRINAGTFGAKMVNGVGRISPTSEIWSAKFR
jgi:hypothetical protein